MSYSIRTSSRASASAGQRARARPAPAPAPPCPSGAVPGSRPRGAFAPSPPARPGASFRGCLQLHVGRGPRQTLRSCGLSEGLPRTRLKVPELGRTEGRNSEMGGSVPGGAGREGQRPPPPARTLPGAPAPPRLPGSLSRLPVSRSATRPSPGQVPRLRSRIGPR